MSFFLTQLGVGPEFSVGFLAGGGTLFGTTTLGGVDVAGEASDGRVCFSNRPMRLATEPRERSSGRPIFQDSVEHDDWSAAVRTCE